MGSVPSQ